MGFKNANLFTYLCGIKEDFIKYNMGLKYLSVITHPVWILNSFPNVDFHRSVREEDMF